ncbi:FAD/NAD(P)-binding protein [Myxococcota bacterium]|nr:FAD/NAD(P)-binding protein [Myxococcota bacterium]MBU1536383.1 FAD/NAD(P)-binding protein [Myxococcota bacterium]
MACGTCNCNSPEIENLFMPKEALITETKWMTKDTKHFVLKWADGSKVSHQPGQIVEASLFGFGEIPLGFATSPTQENSFELVIRQVGRVSTALCKLEAGDTMLIRAPLGKGFPLDELRGEKVMIIAGGLGIVPTRSLINYITDRRDEFKSFTLFYGARNPSELLFKEDLVKWRSSKDVHYFETVDGCCEEDNWKGNTGVITTLFKQAEVTPDTKVIICGPPIMYRFVMMELYKCNVPHENVYVDLERRMKCGVGKCGHCQINDKYVCIDGPVFKYSELDSKEEAL